MANQVRIGNEKRYIYDGPELPSWPRPLNLTAGPQLTWLCLLGDEEALATLEGMRPQFKITIASRPEHVSWQS